MRISGDRTEKETRGQDKRKVQHRLAQDREEEMRRDERRREDRKGEENIREKMRGETLTSEMLSGLVADMTASVPIDRAISLPSPIACCSLAWHSTAQYSTAQHRDLLSLRALFEITSAFVSIGFILYWAFIHQAKFEGIFLPLATHFEMPLAKHDSRKIFQNDNQVVARVVVYLQ